MTETGRVHFHGSLRPGLCLIKLFLEKKHELFFRQKLCSKLNETIVFTFRFSTGSVGAGILDFCSLYKQLFK